MLFTGSDGLIVWLQIFKGREMSFSPGTRYMDTLIPGWVVHESDPNRHDTGELSFGAVAMDRVGLRGWEGGRASGDEALHDYDKVLTGPDVHTIHSPNGTGGCWHHPPPPSSLNKDAISHCQEKTGKQKQAAVKDRAKRLGVITARQHLLLQWRLGLFQQWPTRKVNSKSSCLLNKGAPVVSCSPPLVAPPRGVSSGLHTRGSQSRWRSLGNHSVEVNNTIRSKHGSLAN